MGKPVRYINDMAELFNEIDRLVRVDV